MTSALTATHPAALLTGGAARWPVSRAPETINPSSCTLPLND